MFLSKVKFVALAVLAVGIAGAGTGFLGYRTDAEQPSPKQNPKLAAAAPAGATVKATTKADESKSNAPAPAVLDEKQRLRNWREKLIQSIDYPGLDDQRATLSDALDMLSKRYNLTFDINETAFEMDQLKDVARTPVAETAIPAMRTTLSAVLRKILRRVPARRGATYLIRRDVIEITTDTFVRKELGYCNERPIPPLVWDSFEEMALAQILPRLAESSGYNIAADPKAGEKLGTQITLNLNNVPIDTAVRLVANMAGLSVVRLDNVFYVTTAENAKHLRQEQDKINGDTPVPDAEPPKKPASEKPAK